MPAPRALLAILLVPTLGGCFDSGPSPPPASRYAELEGAEVRGLSDEELRALRAGEGYGMALPAELNGYAGPKHVLDLGRELDLTTRQREDVEAIRAAMLAAAVPAGEDVIRKAAALEDAFRARSVTSEGLGALTGDLAAARADLQAIHLRAHLATDAVLTEHQRALYRELRGYGAGAHDAHAHG
ncbi:MAG TPA: Spy/CpxP family protein refolding chaperone [Candidatus Thermoplasmatota archaeon]|nr:Spy/CpxP family protein refolding chaperone [Candidatus Thermoplasmatota archaeon]